MKETLNPAPFTVELRVMRQFILLEYELAVLVRIDAACPMKVREPDVRPLHMKPSWSVMRVKTPFAGTITSETSLIDICVPDGQTVTGAGLRLPDDGPNTTLPVAEAALKMVKGS